jgi:hypothetical protein
VSIHEELDESIMQARSSLEYFSADKPLPGKFTSWKVDDSKEDNCFPESK